MDINSEIFQLNSQSYPHGFSYRLFGEEVYNRLESFDLALGEYESSILWYYLIERVDSQQTVMAVALRI